MIDDAVMILLEFLAALCAVALCGPCFLACARRWVLGDEVQQGGHGIYEVDVKGCEEPGCPYHKKNMRYLMMSTSRRRNCYSPTRGHS